MKIVATLLLSVFIILIIMSTIYSTNKVHNSLNRFYTKKNSNSYLSKKTYKPQRGIC